MGLWLTYPITKRIFTQMKYIAADNTRTYYWYYVYPGLPAPIF